MIKVMGGKAAQLPIHLAGMSGSSGSGSGAMKATFIKTSSSDQVNRVGVDEIKLLEDCLCVLAFAVIIIIGNF